MPRTHPAYAPEFRRQMVELVRSGRSVEGLAGEFEPSAGAIRNWVKRADLDEGRRSDGLKDGRASGAAAIEARSQTAPHGAGDPKKSRRLVCSGERLDPRAGFEFMKTNQADFPVRVVCRVLGLSPSGYYAWLAREPSARAQRDWELTQKIVTIWRQNRQVYGRPRIYADLKEDGEKVGQKRVGRLMKQAGIVGASRRRRGPKTTRRNDDARPVPDLGIL